MNQTCEKRRNIVTDRLNRKNTVIILILAPFSKWKTSFVDEKVWDEMVTEKDSNALKKKKQKKTSERKNKINTIWYLLYCTMNEEAKKKGYEKSFIPRKIRYNPNRNKENNLQILYQINLTKVFDVIFWWQHAGQNDHRKRIERTEEKKRKKDIWKIKQKDHQLVLKNMSKK